jgi:hypothetical protein
MKTTVTLLAAALITCAGFSARASTSSDVALTLAPAPSVAASALPATPLLTLAPTPSADVGSYLGTGSSSHFAQFATIRNLPVSPTLVFALIALFILGMRLMGLRHAHSMAEHERHSHHGRAQMFRSLHEERSSRH